MLTSTDWLMLLVVFVMLAWLLKVKCPHCRSRSHSRIEPFSLRFCVRCLAVFTHNGLPIDDGESKGRHPWRFMQAFSRQLEGESW